MRILTLTTLYPNAEMPVHGIFVENRLRQLVATGKVEADVVAPVPWFPFKASIFGDYARAGRVPKSEVRHGIPIAHPRIPVIPKIGMPLAPLLYYRSLRAHIRSRLADVRNVDVIDAHYAYPDGVVAAWLGTMLNKPVVVTARGSDLHLIAKYRMPRRQIRSAFRQCTAVVAVSKQLAVEARTLAGPETRVEFLRNGVDLELFREEGREETRSRLGLKGPTLISVGLLIPRKGHELVIRSLMEFEDLELVICGEGPERSELQHLARRTGVADRVHLVGRVPHEQLRHYYSAADVLVLASFREGWPNVLLEAMACGTPVVATSVGAAPDFVNHPDAGTVIEERTPAAIAAAVRTLLAAPPARENVRLHASQFGWKETTSGLLSLFSDVLASGPR